MQNIQDIRNEFNLAIAGSHEKNERCREDREFGLIPGAQWVGSDTEQFKNKPKPENNKIFRAVQRILGQYMRTDFNAKIITTSDDATDEDAELLQARWRNDFRTSDGLEALQTAATEAFFGGFGAFKIVATYDDPENPDEKYQSLSLDPIQSADTSVVFDKGATRKDKADARRAWQLMRVNKQAIEDEFDVTIAPFPNATNDYFNWECEDSSKDVYVAHYYELVDKRVNEYDFGNGLVITRDGRKYTDNNGNKIDKEDFDELQALYNVTAKRKQFKQVEYALICGDQILDGPHVTPFKRIPIVPQYGYHFVINGIEYYMGEVARMRDPQRFENMLYSAMMEIAAQPQVATPEYLPEQIGRHAAQRAKHSQENFAFLMSDAVKNPDGTIAHMGPIAVHQPAPLGSGIAAALQYNQQSLSEQAGTGQVKLPANTSGEAVAMVNEREDDSYQMLFQNAMQAIKSLCECWIPAAQKLYFSNQRNLRIQSEDGSYSRVNTLEYCYDSRRGQYGPYKNSAMGRYEVTVEIGEGFQTKKDAERQAHMEILQYTPVDSEIGQLALFGALKATTGEGTEDIRKIVRMKELEALIAMGLPPKPKTDEEARLIQQITAKLQQQSQQQNPQILLAQAEAEARIKEGEAALMNEHNDANKLQIELMKLKLQEEELRLKAFEIGAKVEKVTAETAGQKLENVSKLFRPN